MRLVKGLLVLALIWSAIWALTAYGLRNTFANWFAARAEEGWQAQFSDATTGGYPFRHKTVLQQPALADPQTGVAWRTDWIGFDSPAIWPGKQTVRFAPTPQLVSYFDNTHALQAADMVANLDLAPGVNLNVNRLSLISGAWDLAADGQTVLAGSGLTLAMVGQDAPGLYQLDAAIPDFSPGARLRAIMNSADNLPESFDTLVLDAEILFDRPWDRRALEERRPQPRRIDLRLAEAAWGPLRLSVAGKVEVDDQGIPDGQITLRAENWRDMLAMAQSAGAVPAAVVDTAEGALNFLAGLDGNRDAIDVRLNLARGFVAVGPVPIGPAPRLILR